MNKTLKDIPVSILDLAPIVEGGSAGKAINDSVQLAKAAERAGFLRHWFAEHHNFENIASSATVVVIGYVANNTKTIRVGAGGIMLPNHAPLIVAEQFGTLDALFPGRIDLGLGRAPGTDQLTSFALRRNLKGSVDDFPNDVVELLEYFHPRTPNPKVRAIPGEGANVPVWLLGSSTFSAQLAAYLGLPFSFASHFAPTLLMEALQIYRDKYQPSTLNPQPYIMAAVNVIAAETDEEAEYLASTFYRIGLGIIRNDRKPLQPPVKNMDDYWNANEKAAFQHMMKYSFIGSEATVKSKLESFMEKTQVDEIMVASYIYDLDKKIKSYEMIAPFFKRSN